MKARLVIFSLAASAALFAQTAPGTMARIATNLGNIDIVLLPESAPATVENFLGYVRRGDYNATIFHRSVRNFVVQGGGYRFVNGRLTEVPQQPPVRNEFRVSNTRGTLAMAKLGSGPNTATNQFFFNLANNAQNLNNQNGGFTVFARVANSDGLAVMDRLAAVPVFAVSQEFDSFPLVNYNGGSVSSANMLAITSITILETARPVISEGGVITASAFGGFRSAAPGSLIEIYGTDLAGDVSRSWTTADFVNGRAPTTLENVSVTVAGIPAFVNFVSKGQVNVQVPLGAGASDAADVVVTNRGQASAPLSLPIRALAPGLLAPASFRVEDVQYVAAAHATTGAFVSNGNIPGIPAAPAVPGETLTFYGVGFGGVEGDTPIAGEIVRTTAAITSSIEFFFGDLPGTVVYAGLAPGLIGVYQFNVTVPRDATPGDATLRVAAGGDTLTQSLAISIARP